MFSLMAKYDVPSTPGAVIYYALDGSIPTTSSAPYDGPITVSSTSTINAIAVASNLPTQVVRQEESTDVRSINAFVAAVLSSSRCEK
jgi:hypothetical protein